MEIVNVLFGERTWKPRNMNVLTSIARSERVLSKETITWWQCKMSSANSRRLTKLSSRWETRRGEIARLTLLSILRRTAVEIPRSEKSSAIESAKWDYAPSWSERFDASFHRCSSPSRLKSCHGARLILFVQRCCPLRFDSMIKLQQLKQRAGQSDERALKRRCVPLATSGIPHHVRRVQITELIDARKNPIDVKLVSRETPTVG